VAVLGLEAAVERGHEPVAAGFGDDARAVAGFALTRSLGLDAASHRMNFELR
jgi:hypothetical protein